MTNPEKRFTALWDTHLISIGGIRADRQLALAILRFAPHFARVLRYLVLQGASTLVRDEMLKVFRRRLVDWRVLGIINDSCVVTALAALREGEDYWKALEPDVDVREAQRHSELMWEMVLEAEKPRRGECVKCGKDVEKWAEAEVRDEGVMHRGCVDAAADVEVYKLPL